MKKELLRGFILIMGLIFLTACGSENANKNEGNSTKPENNEMSSIEDETEEKEEQPKEESADQKNGDENHQDGASKISDEEPIELNEGMAHPLRYYGNEEAIKAAENGELNNDGFIETDFEGFLINSSFFLIDFKPDEYHKDLFENKDNVRSILVMMRAENTNDHDVDYNGNITITTDTKEQVHSDAGVFSSNPVVQTYYGNVEENGYFIIPLKDDSMPEKITVIMDPPYIVKDGGVDPTNGKMGEEVRFKLIGVDE